MASTIDEILTEAPQFVKVLEDLVALGVAADKTLAGKSSLAIITALPSLAPQAEQLEADIVAAYNSVKALGAQQEANRPAA